MENIQVVHAKSILSLQQDIQRKTHGYWLVQWEDALLIQCQIWSLFM